MPAVEQWALTRKLLSQAAWLESLRGRPGVRVEVLEAGQRVEERQPDDADGAVAVLGDDDLGRAGRVIRVVERGAMQEQHHVGVLLDGAGFSEIREPGPVVLALLGLAVELRQ